MIFAVYMFSCITLRLHAAGRKGVCGGREEGSLALSHITGRLAGNLVCKMNGPLQNVYCNN